MELLGHFEVILKDVSLFLSSGDLRIEKPLYERIKK